MADNGPRVAHQTYEYALMNGELFVSGPTPNGEALRGLYERLSEKRGLRLVRRTVTYGEWGDVR